ncbi:unnamed protein product [Calypogeia fissa]
MREGERKGKAVATLHSASQTHKWKTLLLKGSLAQGRRPLHVIVITALSFNNKLPEFQTSSLAFRQMGKKTCLKGILTRDTSPMYPTQPVTRVRTRKLKLGRALHWRNGRAEPDPTPGRR